MTDARLPGPWLNTMRFDALSDTAWRVLTGAMMWSAENGTNGLVPARYLRMLHPDGEQPAALSELVTAALGVQQDGGFRLLDWDGALGQSTALQVETYKANGRKRQRDFRERQRMSLAKAVGFVETPEQADPEPVTRYVTDEATRDVGKGKGEGSYVGVDSRNDAFEVVNQQTGEVTEAEPGPARWESYVEDGKRKRRKVAA